VDIANSSLATKIELKKQPTVVHLRAHHKTEYVVAGSSDGVVRVHGDNGVFSHEGDFLSLLQWRSFCGVNFIFDT